jgi:DNA-binding MarR family transcriptional regulator
MKPLQHEDYESLAAFRYGMRKFLRFSREELATNAQLTPEQYEAILALRAFGGNAGLTIGELGERLQVKHHTAVSLVDKLVTRGVVVRSSGAEDRRRVYVKLTRAGRDLLAKTAAVHRQEMRQRSAELIAALRRLQR